MRDVRACKWKPPASDVKKKIRAIQYGVGPSGPRSTRADAGKQSIEIIGAIEYEPAKVGRDLGEVVVAKDAPWGESFPAAKPGSAGASRRRGNPFHSVVAPKVMDHC